LTELSIEKDYQNIFPRNKLCNSKRIPFRELENAAVGFPKNDKQFSHIGVQVKICRSLLFCDSWFLISSTQHFRRTMAMAENEIP